MRRAAAATRLQAVQRGRFARTVYKAKMVARGSRPFFDLLWGVAEAAPAGLPRTFVMGGSASSGTSMVCRSRSPWPEAGFAFGGTPTTYPLRQSLIQTPTPHPTRNPSMGARPERHAQKAGMHGCWGGTTGMDVARHLL